MSPTDHSDDSSTVFSWNDGGLRSSSSHSFSSSRSQKMRVTVCFSTQLLPNGANIVVPINTSTTVCELQTEALRRLRKMGTSIPTTNLVMRLKSEDGPIAFDEDAVDDVIDREKNNTLWVGPAQPSHSPTNLIHVRWITPGRALDFPTLSRIPPDREPIPRLTTVKNLKGIAMERIYRSPEIREMPLISTFQLRLSLTQCALSTTDEEGTTLEDLGCTGEATNPLNIFVVPISLMPADEGKPHTLWAFTCSERGIATFQTCVKVLMSEANVKASNLRSLLKILFGVTHFPPALEALQVLATENKLEPTAVAVLATCFRELALRMTPHAHVGALDSVLEGSRQIFAWLHSKFGESLQNASDIDDPEAALVRAVVLVELPEEPANYYPGPSQRCEIADIEVIGVANPSSAPTCEGRTLRKIRVETHVNCQEDFTLLALALWGNYDFVSNYYVDFRDNIANPFEHRRIPLADWSDFGRLLVEANKCDRFRMIPPMSLDDNPPPGITLCSQGYVSTYRRDVGHFKDVQSTLENAITGVEVLKSEPGKSICQALEPIIQQRKLRGTWDIDDWETKGKIGPDDFIDPDSVEAIVFCFDLSWSMQTPLGNDWIGNGSENTFSRLDEMKQVFRNAIARIEGYNLEKTHVGLVTFASADQVLARAPISKKRQGFKDELKDAEPTGITALWDGLMKAREMLVSFQSAHPKSKLRIIALTDGEDNGSTSEPGDVCQALYDSNIVLDSIVVGTSCTSDLFRMSKHTGGYAFQPLSRLLLFQIFLLEPFLDISARPPIERVAITDYQTSLPKQADMQTLYDFPPCRPHKLESGAFVSLEAHSRFFPSKHAPVSSYIGQSRTTALAERLLPDRGRPGANAAYPSSTLVPSSRQLSLAPSDQSSTWSASTVGKVYLHEMRLMISNPHSFLDVYVSESDMGFWKVVMQGPESTPYQHGNFLLLVSMTRNYPQTAPLVRFITPILHPNITKHGRICHGILSSDWRPSYHIHDVLLHIFGLLQSPETNDAVDELATLKFWTDRATADAEIQKYIDKFATKSRAGWKAEMAG